MRTLIAVGIDTREVDLIFSRLEEKGSRNQALKKALNLTARQARERLAQKAQERMQLRKRASGRR